MICWIAVRFKNDLASLRKASLQNSESPHLLELERMSGTTINFPTLCLTLYWTVDIQLFDWQWELSQIFAKTRTTFLDIIPTFDRLAFSWMPCSNHEGEGAKPPKTLRCHIANYLEESFNAGWSDCTHKGVHSCVCDKIRLEKAVLEKNALVGS